VQGEVALQQFPQGNYLLVGKRVVAQGLKFSVTGEFSFYLLADGVN